MSRAPLATVGFVLVAVIVVAIVGYALMNLPLYPTGPIR